MSSRRNNLVNIGSPTINSHPGLWFDKFLTEHPSENRQANTKTPYKRLVDECCQMEEPEIYQAVYERWRDRCKRIQATVTEITLNGRLAIGLGNASTIETGATFHHTYGVPIIPGSALKGTAASYARNYLEKDVWGKQSTPYQTIFGSQQAAGYVTFFDALPVPRKLGGKWRIEPDIITVHHPDYYQGKEDAAPADWDSPTPIPFLSVTGKFLVVLYAPDAPAWAITGFGILQMALEEIGIGGKTSSGYGRIVSLSNAKQAKGSQPPVSNPEQAKFVQFKLRLDNLATRHYASELGKFANEWRQSDLAQKHRHNIARAILDLVESTTGKRKKKFRQKSWHQELLDTLPADDFRREKYQ